MRTSLGQFAQRDFTNYRSGKLTMLRPTGEKDKWGYSIWEVRCDCGTVFNKTSQVFSKPKPLYSCGCGPKGRPATMTHLEALYKKHQLNAIARGYPFDLSLDEHSKLILSPCAYCGAPPVERSHPYMKVRIVSNGIDRIDNAVGYIAANCAPCCTICNTAKMTLPVADFKAWISCAYHHMNR